MHLVRKDAKSAAERLVSSPPFQSILDEASSITRKHVTVDDVLSGLSDYADNDLAWNRISNFFSEGLGVRALNTEGADTTCSIIRERFRLHRDQYRSFSEALLRAVEDAEPLLPVRI